MTKKFLQAVVKSVNKEEGTFEVVASCGKQDRFGDTIDPEGWYLKNYKKNPVILWSHSTGGFGSTAIPPVARAERVWVEDKKELKLKGKWADTPFAQELKTLVEGGFLNAVSVGFLPLIETKKGNIEIEGKMYRRATDEEIKKGMYDSDYGQDFTKQELLEVSWVSVPALPQALVSAREMNLALVTKALEEEIKEKETETEAVEKPYPNEHSCRLKPPGNYDTCRRTSRTSDGKKYGVLTCRRKDDHEKWEEQAYRYPKDVWTVPEARKHCTDHKGIKFEPASEKELTNEQFDKIRNFISEMEEAISVLKEEINPEKDATPSTDNKGRKPFVKQKSRKSDMERLLIMFDKMCETLLRKLRQEK